MDTGTIIISAVLIALVILPFIFTGKKYRRQKIQLVQKLNGLAEQNRVKLSNCEADGNFGIGLDQTSCCLFFVRMVQDEVSTREVLLGGIRRCKVKTVSRMVEDGQKIIDRVELLLQPVSSALPEVALEMYNSEYDTLTIRGELEAAVKWEQIINNALKEIKKKDRISIASEQVVFA